MPARTGLGNSPVRAVRVPDDVWQAAKDRAEREGVSVGSVIVAALREYGKG